RPLRRGVATFSSLERSPTTATSPLSYTTLFRSGGSPSGRHLEGRGGADLTAGGRRPPGAGGGSRQRDRRRAGVCGAPGGPPAPEDRKSTRLNSSHVKISYAVFCLKKKTTHRRAD